MRSTSAWTYVQRLSPKSVRQIKIRIPVRAIQSMAESANYMSTRDNHVVHAYPNVHHRLPDSTEKRPQLPDSPVRLGPHNWLQRIFAQTGILSLSGGYKEEEEGRGHELL